MTKNNTKTYISALPDIVDTYNNTKNRYGFRPADFTRSNQYKILRTLYPPKPTIDIKFKFNAGDNVRVSSTSMVFDKGYIPQWSEEIFKISKQIPSDPPRYKLKDYGDEKILGTWYESELQSVNVVETYKFEKILRKRMNENGKREYLVKWIGYPAKFNSWVPEADIKRI